MAASRKTRTSRPSPRASTPHFEPAAPEIKVAYAPVGRETLDAIMDEALESPTRADASTEGRGGSSPEIVVSEGAVGRETLAAIEAELGPPRPTLPKARRGRSSRPPTFHAVEAKVPQRSATRASLEIFEMLTFVVKNTDGSALSTPEQRRQFLGQHLLYRLPGNSLESVSRIDVTPWTERGALMVRVWCRVESSS